MRRRRPRILPAQKHSLEAFTANTLTHKTADNVRAIACFHKYLILCLSLFFREKIGFFEKNSSYLLHRHLLIYFNFSIKIYLGQLKTNDKFHGKKIGFCRFEFVKTCDKFVTDFVCITGTAREYGCPLGSVFKITSSGQDGVCANPADGQ